MTAIYSTRFLLTAPGTTASYTVPTGRTAVIRCVTAVQTVGSAGYFQVYLGPSNVNVIIADLSAFPGTFTNPSSEVYDLRVVVNAGETINGTGQAGISLSVSGYLFTL